MLKGEQKVGAKAPRAQRYRSEAVLASRGGRSFEGIREGCVRHAFLARWEVSSVSAEREGRWAVVVTYLGSGPARMVSFP